MGPEPSEEDLAAVAAAAAAQQPADKLSASDSEPRPTKAEAGNQVSSTELPAD